MDPRLVNYYAVELAHLRELAVEFGSQFPKLAGRLGLHEGEVTDPHVERLLEGAALLAARVQMKLDTEFPRFTSRLLEMLYPNYLAPTPAMLVAELEPQERALGAEVPFTLPRGSALRFNRPQRASEGSIRASSKAGCEFRTARDLTVLPIALDAVSYSLEVPRMSLPRNLRGAGVESVLRLRFSVRQGYRLERGLIERIPLFLAGPEEVAFALHRLLSYNAVALLVRADGAEEVVLGSSALTPCGYDDSEALLPLSKPMFRGYRLLQEYFAFAHRFLFVEIRGLGDAIRGMKGDAFEIIVALDRAEAPLVSAVDCTCVRLHCVPAINLFPKRAERVSVDEGSSAFHVVPDRIRALDFEVYSVEQVVGYGAGGNERHFLPMNASAHPGAGSPGAFFAVERVPRGLGESERRSGVVTDYTGSEVFISLVDECDAPIGRDLRQIAISTLCTNRDLALEVGLSSEGAELAADGAASIARVVVRKRPSRPRPPIWAGDTHWRLVSHLALGASAITGGSSPDCAAQLREMLELFSARDDIVARRQIEAIRSVSTRPSVRRVPGSGPIAFARGVEVRVVVDEAGFVGASAFLFGSVLERFFTRAVTINAFVETVLLGADGRVLFRWEPRWGGRPML